MKTQTVESNKNNSILESRYGIALKKNSNWYSTRNGKFRKLSGNFKGKHHVRTKEMMKHRISSIVTR